MKNRDDISLNEQDNILIEKEIYNNMCLENNENKNTIIKLKNIID